MLQRNSIKKTLPSSRWTSYDDWNYNGLKERLEAFMRSINKQALISHTQVIFKKTVTMSEPFSAGQHWACFELIMDDDSIVIARARLPRHPDTPKSVTASDEAYSITCEIATMEFLRHKVLNVPFPRLHEWAPPGSDLATEAGCAYMLIEGFYGNTLSDVQFDICQLPITQQEHIISQWTAIQAELATMTFPQIGSISHVSETGEPTLDKLSCAPLEGLPQPGPFNNAVSYFEALAKGRLRTLEEESDCDDEDATASDRPWSKLGVLAFLDIVQNTDIFRDDETRKSFHLNHMDLGTQNIIVDENFNFLAVIDWEFAQSAPWSINHYPMPFPLIDSPVEEKSILSDPGHIAFQNVTRQVAARGLYRRGFEIAEQRLRIAGCKLDRSIAEIIDSPASRIYGCFEKIGVFHDQAEALTREIVRLAYDYDGPALDAYFDRLLSSKSGIQTFGNFYKAHAAD